MLFASIHLQQMLQMLLFNPDHHYQLNCFTLLLILAAWNIAQLIPNGHQLLTSWSDASPFPWSLSFLASSHLSLKLHFKLLPMVAVLIFFNSSHHCLEVVDSFSAPPILDAVVVTSCVQHDAGTASCREAWHWTQHRGGGGILRWWYWQLVCLCLPCLPVV